MFESLAKYGLPTKYAIVGSIGGNIAAFIAYLLELSQSQVGLLQPHLGQPAAAILADSSAKSVAKTVD